MLEQISDTQGKVLVNKCLMGSKRAIFPREKICKHVISNAFYLLGKNGGYRLVTR